MDQIIPQANQVVYHEVAGDDADQDGKEKKEDEDQDQEILNMPHWTKGRLALVGDAGYAVSPFAGQGSSVALVGAYVLAGELSDAQG